MPRGSGKPVIAIGGMDAGPRRRGCSEAGAYGVAAISALWKRRRSRGGGARAAGALAGRGMTELDHHASTARPRELRGPATLLDLLATSSSTRARSSSSSTARSSAGPGSATPRWPTATPVELVHFVGGG